MGVSFMKYELRGRIELYEKVSDCCDGDFKVKSRSIRYLPQPDPDNESDANMKRYKAYLDRAVFYNVTKNTHAGLLGQIFAKESQIELPSDLSILETNCDGKGNSIEQVARQGISGLLKKARFGLYSDFPKSSGDKSKPEMIAQNIRPVIKLYESDDIINWEYFVIGAETIYSSIVLREIYTLPVDEFEMRKQYRYRHLFLNDAGNFQVDIYESPMQSVNVFSGEIDSINNMVFTKSATSEPLDYAGINLDRIPFEFSGAETNTAEPGVPVLYDIAVLNIGHYHNSADYEESCYVSGQPTTFISGLSEEWVKSVLGGTVQLGSRGGVPLPVGGSAVMLQAMPNIQPYEAMQHKERQFLAIGAKLVSPTGPAVTATEANMNNTTETSILATLANNASQAFENAIEHCQKFVKSSGKIVFKINNDFEISKMPVPERAQLLKEWMSEAISKTEMRTELRKGGVELLTDEEAQAQIDAEVMKDFATAAADPNFVDPKLALAAKTKAPFVGKGK